MDEKVNVQQEKYYKKKKKKTPISQLPREERAKIRAARKERVNRNKEIQRKKAEEHKAKMKSPEHKEAVRRRNEELEDMGLPVHNVHNEHKRTPPKNVRKAIKKKKKLEKAGSPVPSKYTRTIKQYEAKEAWKAKKKAEKELNESNSADSKVRIKVFQNNK